MPRLSFCLRDGRIVTAPSAPIDRRAVIDIQPFGIDPGCTHKLDLLGFAIPKRHGTLERVKVVLVEGLLGHGRAGGVRCGGHCSSSYLFVSLDLADIASHELDASLLEVLAALIVDCHPADEIELLAIFRGYEVVVGLPAHASGNVTELGVEFAGIAGLQLPAQFGLENGLIRERREDWHSRQLELELSIHLNDRLCGICRHGRLRLIVGFAIASHRREVVRGISATDDPALDNAVRFLRLLHEKVDLLALEK